MCNLIRDADKLDILYMYTIDIFKLTEKGAGLIYAVIRKYGVASRDDKWAISLIKEVDNPENLDHIYSW